MKLSLELEEETVRYESEDDTLPAVVEAIIGLLRAGGYKEKDIDKFIKL